MMCHAIIKTSGNLRRALLRSARYERESLTLELKESGTEARLLSFR